MATTTLTAVKAGSTSVSTVIVNGITVFGTTSTTTTYNLGNIYVQYNGYDGSSRYFSLMVDSLTSGASIRWVVCAGTQIDGYYHLYNNVNPVWGDLTSTSSLITLPKTSSTPYCSIGLVTSGSGTSSSPLLGGTISSRGTISGTTKYKITSGSYSLPMTNIPYGDSSVQGANASVYLLYSGACEDIRNKKQVYPATTWKVKSSSTIRNLKVTT